MKSAIRRYYAVAAIVLWTIACWTFFQFWYPYHFFFQAQNQLFLWSPDYIASHAIEMAEKMKIILQEAGLQFYIDSPTNQQFVIIPNERMHRLEQHVQFTHWEPFDEQSMVCRFVTSWATTDEDLTTLKRILEEIR